MGSTGATNGATDDITGTVYFIEHKLPSTSRSSSQSSAGGLEGGVPTEGDTDTVQAVGGRCLAAVPPPGVTGLDQYMMGDSMMAAPVLCAGQRERDVYFPKGRSFRHHFTNVTYEGGTVATVATPLDSFPLFHVV